MARENQGLQIGLIVLVMLTIILSVTTYLFYRQYDEAAKNADAAAKAKIASDELAGKNAHDAEELKRLIGVAATESIETIRDTTFKDDMKKYGLAHPEEILSYRPLLEKMAKTIRDKNAELDNTKAEIPRLEGDYKKRKAELELEVKQFRDASTKASQDLASEQSKFKSERDRITEDETKLHSEMQSARKEGAAKLTEVQNQLQRAEGDNKKLTELTEEATSKIEKLTRGKMGAPNGEISWVNQRNGTVWINLGRADALSRQVSFSVYPADSSEATESKAGIEVTQILGDHLAEARIVDDKVADPIIPGDKIFTPLWSPGERRHFALVGLMDVDGDGRNGLDTVMNIIRSNGGVVDCYIGDSGKDRNQIKGAISINTNCLIVGPAPDDKAEPAQRESFTKILRKADEFRLQKMQLADFLQRIGWKNMSPVVRFGHGATASDFRAKPEGRTQKKSTGNTSDVFKEREPPPVRSPSSSYYRF